MVEIISNKKELKEILRGLELNIIKIINLINLKDLHNVNEIDYFNTLISALREMNNRNLKNFFEKEETIKKFINLNFLKDKENLLENFNSILTNMDDAMDLLQKRANNKNLENTQELVNIFINLNTQILEFKNKILKL